MLCLFYYYFIPSPKLINLTGSHHPTRRLRRSFLSVASLATSSSSSSPVASCRCGLRSRRFSVPRRAGSAARFEQGEGMEFVLIISLPLLILIIVVAILLCICCR